MRYDIAIVIAAHNNHATLPALLESIGQQDIIDAIEIIIVDDFSSSPYNEMVDTFRKNGLHITLLRNETHKRTKDTRLIGVSASTSDILTFVDADDLLWGTTSLSENVRLYKEEKADLLHFPAIQTSDVNGSTVDTLREPPFKTLSGPKIFSQFVSIFSYWNLWDKLYDAQLWRQLIPTAMASPIQRYFEDMYLFFLYAFHARKYVSSKNTGYLYHFRPEVNYSRAAGRLFALDALIQDFIAYLAQNNCPPEVLDTFLKKLIKRREINVSRLVSFITNNPSELELITKGRDNDYPLYNLARTLLESNAGLANEIIKTAIRTHFFYQQ